MAVALGGNLTLATGEYSLAQGPFARATNFGSIAFGSLLTSSGYFSYAQGVEVSSSGEYSWASGMGAYATGDYSTARGTGATASGRSALAIGEWVYSQSYAEAVFGRYNSTITTSPTTWVATDALFRVGNGSSSTDKSDAVTVLKNGKMTVTNKAWKANASSPLADPTAADDSGGSALEVDGHTKLNGKVEISVPQGDISMGIYQ